MEKTDEMIAFNIESSSEAIEFKRIATGRKFCKIGERLIDIYVEELERYKYETSKNILFKIAKYRKYKAKNTKLMLESRTTSCIRAVIAYSIRNNNKQDQDNIISESKKIILDKVSEYNNKNKESKIININEIAKKEA